MKALWARSRDEVSDDEYHELYKHISPRLARAAGDDPAPGGGHVRVPGPCSSSPRTPRTTCSRGTSGAASSSM
ncbi:hypothetical protein [Streptomyces violaceus]|uniref:hypothetical protein n=1 Tax=Streptomyces violaceus TaxID=1936 RepID=UPI003CD06DF8